jgi:alkyl hydroperoxide reductase subunit AhpF
MYAICLRLLKTCKTTQEQLGIGIPLTMFTSQLNPQQRAAALTALASEEFDVLIIGGGVNGVGTALDAVTRGLKVALVEAQDYAAGTSSRSSKIDTRWTPIFGAIRF